MRILRRLCADAHSAYMMRGYVFCAFYAQMRRCDYAHIMRILSVDAHTMQICSYYAHIIRICSYYSYYKLQIKHSPPLLTYTDPPRWWNYPPAPALIHCKLVRLGANTFPLGSMCAAAQNAQRQSQSRESQKRIIFRRILEQEGETSKNQ